VHYLITGHTGFKGSWLSLILKEHGHEVSGLALDPLPGSLYHKASLETIFKHDVRLDIRNQASVDRAFDEIKPDFVFHLAAQPLVLQSLSSPRQTFEVNVNGTLNVLSAIAETESVLGAVIVTTDKVYANYKGQYSLDESEPLGARDPYSTSKSMADLLTQAWSKLTPGKSLSIARAGNVFGGGDVSRARIVPDIVNAIDGSETLILRNPDSVRPWQHVLDCLNGYMVLAEANLIGKGDGAWNFGPPSSHATSVRQLVALMLEAFESDVEVDLERHQADTKAIESEYLMLDSTKAFLELGWKSKLTLQQSCLLTASWHSKSESVGAREVTVSQIRDFFNLDGVSR
jgi:CDP-glucose 4,6-dehydratase